MRTLELMEVTPTLSSQRVVFSEGNLGRIVRLRQSTRGRARLPVGSDHALIIDMRGTEDVERWKNGKCVGKGTLPFSITTMIAGSYDDWVFKSNDVIQFHLPDAHVREMYADLCDADPDRLEVSEVLGAPDPTANYLANWLVLEAAMPGVSQVYLDSISICIAHILLGRFSNAAGHPALPRAIALQSTSDDIRIARAVDYIEAHLGEALTVAELASVACLSPAHFSRTFKATKGEAVWAYVQRRRCEKARELLATTRLPIAEVAHRCGFASQAHLTSSFKRLFGVTPGTVRQDH